METRMRTEIKIESAPVHALRNEEPCVIWICFNVTPTLIQKEEEKKEFAETVGEKIKAGIYKHLIGGKP